MTSTDDIGIKSKFDYNIIHNIEIKSKRDGLAQTIYKSNKNLTMKSTYDVGFKSKLDYE